MYVVYGNPDISIAQLNPDGLSQNKTQQVFSGLTDMQGLEGNRLYKKDGFYYVLDDSPQGVAPLYGARSTSGAHRSTRSCRTPFNQRVLCRDS